MGMVQKTARVRAERDRKQMAKLIQSDGAERNVIPPTRRGFRWHDLARLVGPDLLLVPLNASIILIASSTLSRQALRNDKATRIAQFALSDPFYQVYGAALFANADELELFLDEIREEQQAGQEQLIAQEDGLRRCRQPRTMRKTYC
jgi:hypothetical protein